MAQTYKQQNEIQVDSSENDDIKVVSPDDDSFDIHAPASGSSFGRHTMIIGIALLIVLFVTYMFIQVSDMSKEANNELNHYYRLKKM